MHSALFGVIVCMTNHPGCLLSLATGLIYLSIDRQKARSPLSDIVKHTALRSGACFLFWECYKICSDQNKICTRIKYNDNYAVFLWLNNCQEVNVQLAQFYASDRAMLHDKYCQMSILNNRNLFVDNRNFWLNFYWTSRLIAVLTESDYASTIQIINRYQNAAVAKGRQLIHEYDLWIKEEGYKPQTIHEANEMICREIMTIASDTLSKVLLEASRKMKCNYNRADN